jgi:hypothetical protein
MEILFSTKNHCVALPNVSCHVWLKGAITMKKLQSLASALAVCFIFLTFAKAQVVKTERGKVEFIGLKRWSIKMIEDSLAVYSPKGHGLWGCAAELVADLHFADASVIRYSEDSGHYSVITVVEPQDSTQIQYRQKPSGSETVLSEFTPLDSVISKDYMCFQIALINYHLFLTARTDSLRAVLREWGVDSASANNVWRFLASKRNEKHKSLAIRTSLHNPNLINRVIASAILANFPEDDSSWCTLMEVLRDREPIVNTTARQSLTVMAKSSAKPVNWTPCVQTLRHLLAGTNLFAYTTVLDVLHQTRIPPSLASQLLNESTKDLLLAHLQAHHEQERNFAHEFLRSLAGEDFGTDPAIWRKWIERTMGQK